MTDCSFPRDSYSVASSFRRLSGSIGSFFSIGQAHANEGQLPKEQIGLRHSDNDNDASEGGDDLVYFFLVGMVGGGAALVLGMIAIRIEVRKQSTGRNQSNKDGES